VEAGLGNVAAVAGVAFVAPLLLGLVPRLALPAVVVELVAGIVLGPAVLGWIAVDGPVEVLALLGLAFLLFLAGLEIEPERLRGAALRLAVGGFAASFALGLVAGGALALAGLAREPVFLAVVLSATALGVIVPVLKDAGRLDTDLGQLVVVAATVADLGTIVLLSLLFSTESSSPATRALLIAALVAGVALLAIAGRRAARARPVARALGSLQDTTAQIRLRGAFAFLAVLAAVAAELGLELILGAFIAGAALAVADRDRAMTHPDLRRKLGAVGFGVFVPAFFVTSGVRFDLDALVSDLGTLARVPLYLACLLAVRGLPALLYRRVVGSARATIAAGLLQATSLSFVVAATAVGLELGAVGPADAAALVGAGLLSVLLFPVTALGLLDRDARAAA